MRQLRLVVSATLISLGTLGLFGCNPQSNESSSSSSTSASSSESFSETSIDTSASESSSSEAVTHIDFPHAEPAALLAGSGSGYTDVSNWAPNMCFPLADEGFANSQVYGKGGSNGGGGSQCDSPNYSYPWRDNFCESRSWTNVFCGSGQGHQGQDIRPKTCAKDTYWAVAAEDGTVTSIGTYTVTLVGDGSPHRIYRYLHMQTASLKVAAGDHVARGQKLGKVSNNMGSTPTTIHLHYEIRIAQQETGADGTVYAAQTFVPPYTALVDAYQRKLAGDCPTLE